MPVCLLWFFSAFYPLLNLVFGCRLWPLLYVVFSLGVCARVRFYGVFFPYLLALILCHECIWCGCVFVLLVLHVSPSLTPYFWWLIFGHFCLCFFRRVVVRVCAPLCHFPPNLFAVLLWHGYNSGGCGFVAVYIHVFTYLSPWFWWLIFGQFCLRFFRCVFARACVSFWRFSSCFLCRVSCYGYTRWDCAVVMPFLAFFPLSLLIFGDAILTIFVCVFSVVCLRACVRLCDAFTPTLCGVCYDMCILVGAVCLLRLFLCFSLSVLFICVRVYNIFYVRVCVVCLCFCVPSWLVFVVVCCFNCYFLFIQAYTPNRVPIYTSHTPCVSPVCTGAIYA